MLPINLLLRIASSLYHFAHLLDAETPKTKNNCIAILKCAVCKYRPNSGTNRKTDFEFAHI